MDRKTHLKCEVKEKWRELIRTPTLGYKTALQDGKRTGTYYIVPLYSGWAIKVLPATSLIHSVTHRFIQYCMPKLSLTFTYIFRMDASGAREGSVSCPTEDINPSLEKLGIHPPSFWLWWATVATVTHYIRSHLSNKNKSEAAVDFPQLKAGKGEA